MAAFHHPRAFRAFLNTLAAVGAAGLMVLSVAAQSGPPADASQPATRDAQHLAAQLALRDRMVRGPASQDAGGATTATQDSGAAPASQDVAPTTPGPTEAERARIERMRRMEEMRASARASTQHAGAGRDYIGPPPDAETARNAAGRDYVGPPTQDELNRSARNTTDFVGPPTTEELDRIASGRRRGDYTGPPTTEELDRVEAARRAARRQPKTQTPETPATEGQTEWFNYAGVPWEDVIKQFARRLGKPLMEEGDIPLSGELTYVNTRRKFSQEEAIDELNFLLNEQGYRFVETDNFIRLVPLNEMYRHVPLERVFTSRQAFELANLRDMDYALVYHKVEGRDAQELVDMFASAVPDDSMPVVVERSNQIKMAAIVRDIRRFMALVDRVGTGEFDPRETRFFTLKTNVNDIERMVREMFDISDAARPRIDPRTRQPMPAEPATTRVRMATDERTNTLIVKANKDDMTKIADFIQRIDDRPPLDFDTHVIEVKYGNAAEIANLLNQIFQQEQGQSQLAALQRQRLNQPAQRGRQPVRQPQQAGGVSIEDLLGEGIFEKAKKTIRMVADERTNSLIVYANKDGVEKVKKMLEVIDKPLPSNFKTFKLENAKVSQIAEPLNQLAQSLRGAPVGPRGAASARGVSIVPDENANVIHVVAEREEMNKIEELIRRLDVAIAEGERHVVELVNLVPSQVATMLAPIVDEQQAPARSAFRGPGRRAGGGAAMTAGRTQLIPLDEARILLVICDEETWKKVDETIRLWDGNAVSSTPIVQSFEIAKGDPNAIAAMLGSFYQQYNHPTLGRSSVAVTVADQTIWVQGVRPALDEIAGLVSRLDVPPQENPIVIIPLLHSDATQVAQLAQPLLAGAGVAAFGPRGARGGAMPGDNSVAPEPATNSLIVQADPDVLARVKAFARELEDRAAGQQPERKYFDIQNAQAREVAQTITSLYQSGGGRGGGRFGGASVGSRVMALPSGSQVVVEAPREKLAEIAEMIRTLDVAQGGEIVIKTIRMPGTDVNSIAQRLNNAFRQKVQKQGMIAQFDPDATTETIMLTCSTEALQEAEALLVEYKEISVPVTPDVQFRQLKHASAQEGAAWLKELLTTSITRTQGRSAAAQLSISPDTRTNRVIVSGPQVAVKQGMMLLDQFDVPTEELAAIGAIPATKTVNLPGLDVSNLANILNQTFSQRPPRPDKLKFNFAADRLTETLIVTGPPDTMKEIDDLIRQWQVAAEELAPLKKSYTLENADANHVAEQLRQLLVAQVEKSRGADVARRITITPEPRLNQVIVNAPKSILPDFDAQVAEIDRKGEEITPVTIELKYQDPNQIKGMLDQMFGSGGRRSGANTLQDVVVSVTANRLVVRAPTRKLEEIRKLVDKLDEEAKGLEFKAYALKVLDATQTAFGVQAALSQMSGPPKPGQLKPGAFAEPTTNTLIVMADADQIPFIDGLIAKLESTPLPVSEPRSYTLLNARADQVSANVEQMLKAKVTEREGMVRKNAVQTAVVAEPRSNRLIVFAPREYHDLAGNLIKLIDAEPETGEIVRIVPLELADASSVANSLNQVLQGGGVRGGGRQVKIVPDAGSNILMLAGLPKDVAYAEELVLPIEERGSTVPRLQTFSLEHASTTRVQETIETMFPSGRTPADAVTVSVDEFYSKVIVTASARKMKQIEEVIAQLDAPRAATEKGMRELYFVDVFRGDPYDISYDVSKLFPDPDEGGPEIDSPLFGDYITVRCRPAEFPEIEKRIREFDKRAKVERKSIARKLRGDQSRLIAMLKQANPDVVIQMVDRPADLPSLVEPLFPEDQEHPYDRQKREQREREGARRGNRGAEDRDGAGSRDGATDSRRGALAPPANGGRALARGDRRASQGATRFGSSVRPARADAAAFELAAATNDEFLLSIDDEIFAGQAQDVGRAVRGAAPPTQNAASGETDDSGSLPAAGSAALADEPRSRTSSDEDFPATGGQSAPATGQSVRPGVDLPPVARPLRAFGHSLLLEDELGPQLAQATPAQPRPSQTAPAARPQPPDQPAPRPAAARPADDRAAASDPPAGDDADLKREPVQIQQLPDGRVVITGQEDKVDDLIDLLEEIEEDLESGEVIRIFELKYGDVNSAAQILDRMFNEQQVLRIQQPQQPQQGRQRGQQGGEEERGQNPQMDMLRQMMGMGGAAGRGNQQGGAGGRAGGPRIRMATDPGHNRLIVKCDQTDLPEIKQLLLDLDIPPGQVDIRIFQLRNLDASETANNIKEVLGITRAQGARQNPFAGRGGGNPQQQQLMQILQEQMVVSMAGGEGGGAAKIESVQIVPNAVTNSLMVSAPPDVMEIIEKTILDLETLEGRDIVGIHRYELSKAKVDDVLPLLEEVFSAVSGAGGGRPLRGTAGGSKPGSIGAVSISGDPRSNTLIFTAEAKDVAIVEQQIRLLDIEGNINDIETYVCQWNDAASIVAAIEETLLSRGAGGRRPGRDGAAAGGGSTDVRISAEANTNTILVYGPQDQRDLIFREVQRLDELGRRDVTEIPVVYADPAKLAEKLTGLFTNASVAQPGGEGPRIPGGGRRGARGSATTGGNVLIFGDPDAKKLLVRAPANVLTEIRSLVKLLDAPSKMLELKRFELKFAKADAVVESLRNAMTDYITVARAAGANAEFDPFTVLPDARTNSVTVVGSPQTFLFVEAALATIDVETPEGREKQFRIFSLREADAVTVADAINAFVAGGESVASPAAQPAGGRRRGPGSGLPGGAGGAAPGTGNTIDVVASAEPSTNSVFLFGTPDDIKRIERAIIIPMEQSSQRRIARIEVKNVPPSTLYSQIAPMLQVGADDGEPRGGAQITPNDNGKSLVVWGTEAEIEKITALASQFDDPALAAPQVKIVQVPYGQRAAELATVVERVVNDGERLYAESRGLPPRQVTIGADEYSNSLLVYGEPSMYGMVESIVSQLGSGAGNVVTQVLDLGKLNSDEAIQLINDVQDRRSGGSGGGGRSIAPRRGGTQGGGSTDFPAIRRQPGSRTGGNRPSGNRPSGAQPSRQRPQTPRAQPSRPPGRVQAAPFEVVPAVAFAAEPPGYALAGGAFVSVLPAEVLLGGAAVETLVRELFDESHSPATEEPVAPPETDEARHAREAQIVRDALFALRDKSQAAERGAASRPVSRDGRSAIAAQPATRAFGNFMDDESVDETEQPAAQPTQPQPRPRDRAAQPQERPARPATRPRPAAQTRPARPARAQPAQPAPQAPAPQPAQPAEAPATAPGDEERAQITAISGALRGDVLATPVDSNKIIITGDERDVAFIRQMLELMNTEAEQPELRVFPLETAKAAALGPILQQTVEAIIQQSVGTPGRRDQISIVAEAKSNSLIVSASETNMAMIETLIAQLDRENATAGSEFKLVKLNHLRAAEALTLLQPTVQKLNELREVPSESQASVQADTRANAILIVGTPNDIAEIEKLVTAIDVELPAEDDFSTGHVAVIELKNGIAEEMAETLNELIEAERVSAASLGPATGGAGGARAAAAGPLVRRLLLTTADGQPLPPLNLDKPIKVLPVKSINAILTYSTDENNAALREITTVFDTLPEGEEVDVRSFALEHAQAEQVKTLLTDLFEQSKKALTRPAEGGADRTEQGVFPPVPPNLAGRGLPYDVTVAHDTRSNTVFVVGRRDAVLLAAGLIEQMDKPSAELGMKSYVYTLKNMPSTALSEKLNELLDQRAEALGGENTARDSAVILPDERSNTLIIIATPGIYEMVSGLARQIDEAASYRIVDTRYTRLRFADSAKLQKLLQDLFDKKKEAETETNSESKDSLSVLADPRSNSLVMTGTRDYLDEAAALVNQLDQRFDPTVVFKVRPVRLNSASNIATLLTDMVEKSREGEESQGGTPVHIAADSLSNTLLLAASAEDMQMIERWVESLDIPQEPGRIKRIIPLRRGNPEEIAENMQSLYESRGAAGGGGGGGATDLTVTFDNATKSVIAVGPPAIVADIESMIRQLDETEPKAQSVLRLFKLTQADAEDAGDLLTNILEGRGGAVGGQGGSSGGGSASAADEAERQVMLVFQRENQERGLETLRALRSEIKVTAIVRNNSLAVQAPPESMALMESLVAAIDVPPDTNKYRVFPLKNADAEEMVTLLEKLFQTGEEGGRTSGAGADGEQRVLEAGGGGRQEVSFTADLRTNSVVAAGTVGYLDLVEKVILDLDSQGIDERNLIAYQPRNTLAPSIAETLQQVNDAEQARIESLGEQISPQRRMEREFSAVANEDANTIVINADRRFESDVRRIVNELDKPPPQVSIEVQIIEVTMDSSLDLGVEFAFQDLQFAKAGPSDTNTFDYVGGTDLGAAGGTLGGFTFTITGADFNFLLRTLQSEGNINVLSRPQIVAMDNQEASFEIINDVPFVNSTSTTSAGQITTSVDRTEVGIILTVTPQINPDGFVRLKIRQEVSDIADSSIAVGPGVTAPVFFRRVADTTVSVKDSETVVLGGLIQTRDSRSETKVPVIGDFPLLGPLFRNQTESSRRTELLIVLTPRVIRTVEDFHDVSVDERDTMQGLPQEFLTNPSLGTLRVTPVEPLDESDAPADLPPSDPQDETPAHEPFGPQRPPAAPRNDPKTNPNSYDVPVTRRTQ